MTGARGILAKEKYDNCPGPALCKKCFWSSRKGGFCSGCDDDYKTRCLKRSCYSNCNACSGGQKAETPGVCGRTAVFRHEWKKGLKQILEARVKLHKPDPVRIKTGVIPVIYPEVKKYRIPEKFPEVDAWVVPLHKVMGNTGWFYSDDFKDYLGLSRKHKLILSTSVPDDYQEFLWHKRGNLDFKKYNADYWFPAHFSIYDDDSKLYQFFSAKRQQINALDAKSQFAWFRLGEHIPVEFIKPVKKMPSIVFSKGHIVSGRTKEIVHREVKKADDWFPQNTTFFILGKAHGLPINKKRRVHEIDSTWIMRGLKGRDLKGRPGRYKRWTMLKRNLAAVIEDAELHRRMGGKN